MDGGNTETAHIGDTLAQLSLMQTKILDEIQQVRGDLAIINRNMSVQQNEIKVLRLQNAKLSQEVQQLKTSQMKNEQLAVTNTIEIRGIPIQKDEDLIFIFLKIIEALGLNINVAAIDTIFRSQSKHSIVLKLTRGIDKEAILKKSKQKHLNGNLLGLPYCEEVFMSEMLSPHAAKIFYEARKLKKEFSIKFVWHRDGRILMKKNETDSTLRLQSLDEIHELRKHLLSQRERAPNENIPPLNPNPSKQLIATNVSEQEHMEVTLTNDPPSTVSDNSLLPDDTDSFPPLPNISPRQSNIKSLALNRPLMRTPRASKLNRDRPYNKRGIHN